MASPSLPYTRNWPLSTDTSKSNFVYLLFTSFFFLLGCHLSSFHTSFCPLSPAFPSFFALLPIIFHFYHSFTLPFILFFSLFVLSAFLPHFHFSTCHFLSFSLHSLIVFPSSPPSIHPSCRIYPDSRARAQLYLQSFSRALDSSVQWKNFPLKSCTAITAKISMKRM